jgi:hypothetical protein
MVHLALTFTVAQSHFEEDICKSVGTSTTLSPKLEENKDILLLNNICLPVHREIQCSEITVNQGVTGN